MKIDRREFLVAAAVSVVTACSGNSELGGPSPVQNPIPNPGTQAPQTPIPPNPPQSTRGIWHRGGTAGISGSLEEVLRAAKLIPEVNNMGLVIEIDGRPAPQPASSTFAMDPANGFYFFHVNGEFIGSGSAREIQLEAKDTWDAFDWNGI